MAPQAPLLGEVAHEYAHVRRSDTWRHFVFSLLATEIGAVGLTAWLIGVSRLQRHLQVPLRRRPRKLAERPNPV